MARENPLTEGTWGFDWLLNTEDSDGGGLGGFQSLFPGGPRIGGFELSGFPLGQGATTGITTGGGSGGGTWDFPQLGNDAMSGFSLANLGGIFGGSDKTNNGMGDLYNLLLALNTGKGGANGTNLFSGIEV